MSEETHPSHKDANNIFVLGPQGRGGNPEDSSLLHSLTDLKVCILSK